MNSLIEVKHKIQIDPENWEIPFMDLVDDFRRNHKAVNIETPWVRDNNKFDALIASTVEYLCHEQAIEIPNWILKIPACRRPWFVAGMENLKAIALVESPLEFRLRKIFVLENFLYRV